MLSGVAHELNNPPSNISSSAQILKEDIQCDAEFRAQLIADIDAETLRARRIVRTLLDYSGEHANEFTRVPLAELVEETLRFLKNKRPAGVAVVLDIAPELAVFGDRPRLQQVLLNLIVNAYDAMGAHGRLIVTARAAIVGEHDEHFPALDGPCRVGSRAVDISVTDTGPGIAPEIIERIFDPFFTTKAVGHGSGLGLFVAFEIIEQHGGCMAAANCREGGAAFYLRLPVTPKESP